MKKITHMHTAVGVNQNLIVTLAFDDGSVEQKRATSKKWRLIRNADDLEGLQGPCILCGGHIYETDDFYFSMKHEDGPVYQHQFQQDCGEEDDSNGIGPLRSRADVVGNCKNCCKFIFNGEHYNIDENGFPFHGRGSLLCIKEEAK